MENYNVISLPMNDGEQVNVYIWDEIKNPIGVVQLVHGSCEHIMRYQRFVNFLINNNIAVVGYDIRGHGQTAYEKRSFGFFKKEHGWDQIINDAKSVNDYIHETFPGLPVYIFGHSMGSFIVRDYLSRYKHTVEKAIICGTGTYNPLLIKIMLWVANYRIKKYGLYQPDKFLYKLSYLPLNKKFKRESSSIVAWLSCNPRVWALYLNDKLTFKYFTTCGYRDLAYGINKMINKKTYADTPKDVPLLFISGGDDPVGNFGKGVSEVVENYKKNHCDCTLKIYPQLRHEILNEPSYIQVQNDILEFIEK